MSSLTKTLWRGSPAALLLVLVACGGGDSNAPGEPSAGATHFQTDWPSADDVGRGAVGADGFANAGAPTGGSAAPAPTTPGALDASGGEAARAIVEADIIQLHGDRLYALSRMTGLNVVDVSDPSRLRLLGGFTDTRDAEPFELYLRDDVALVMFTGWGRYEAVESVEEGDEPAYAWVQTSEVLALDVSDPGNIGTLGSFEIPGAISDSRIVGDVLYVVGYEDGYCWDCDQAGPRTAVVSLNVSDPGAIAKVDELGFADQENQWGWNRRSVSVTTDRMYVAGPEYGSDRPVGSSIQVVDISDPAGDMALGAVVEAEGEISSRWQMDEHAGVLRVISQPPQWDLTEPPVIQTFQVDGPDAVTALGRAEMQLPRPEQLQSVRFDGDRAYAITAQRTDPLFTIDLSEPAAPRQMGELEMPGFVYHMEPRGDRVVGLGFDQGNEAGAITVSIFDVSDMAAPTMLDRVNFGGSWGYLPEDQDRIHKVFKVLDEAGLILVPYSGYDETLSEGGCWRGDTSRVQLVDFTPDSLALEGDLPSRGEARRAFLSGDHVFTVNDQQVEAFDVTDRAAPALRGSLALARNVTRAVPMAGDLVARFSDDWWDDSMTVDFAPADAAHRPAAAQGEIDLHELVGQTDGCNSYARVVDAFADSDQLFVVYESESWGGTFKDEPGAVEESDYVREHGLIVVDASDPASPEVAGRVTWEPRDDFWIYDGFWAHGIPVKAYGIARFDGGLALLERGYVEDLTAKQDADRYRDVFRLRVIDTRDTGDMGVATVALPDRLDYSGLGASGTTLVASHFEPIGGSHATRFYMDRIDVSDPAAPRVLSSVNVPGMVMSYDGAAGQAVTMDLRGIDGGTGTWQDCAERFAIFDFEWPTSGDRGACTGYQQILRLVSVEGDVARLLASHELAEDQGLRRFEVGDGRLVGTVGRDAGYGGIAVGGPAIAIDCFGPCGFAYQATEPEQLLVLSGFADGELRTGTLELTTSADPWYGWWGASNLVAAGQRALVTSRGELAIIDLSEPESPAIMRTEAFSGYASSVAVAGDRVVLALGAQGVRIVDM